MGNISIRELRLMGVSSDDIDMARATQEAQRRNGYPVQSLAVIVGVSTPRKITNGVDRRSHLGGNPVELT